MPQIVDQWRVVARRMREVVFGEPGKDRLAQGVVAVKQKARQHVLDASPRAMQELVRIKGLDGYSQSGAVDNKLILVGRRGVDAYRVDAVGVGQPDHDFVRGELGHGLSLIGIEKHVQGNVVLHILIRQSLFSNLRALAQRRRDVDGEVSGEINSGQILHQKRIERRVELEMWVCVHLVRIVEPAPR